MRQQSSKGSWRSCENAACSFNKMKCINECSVYCCCADQPLQAICFLYWKVLPANTAHSPKKQQVAALFARLLLSQYLQLQFSLLGCDTTFLRSSLHFFSASTVGTAQYRQLFIQDHGTFLRHYNFLWVQLQHSSTWPTKRVCRHTKGSCNSKYESRLVLYSNSSMSCRVQHTCGVTCCFRQHLWSCCRRCDFQCKWIVSTVLPP